MAAAVWERCLDRTMRVPGPGYISHHISWTSPACVCLSLGHTPPSLTPRRPDTGCYGVLSRLAPRPELSRAIVALSMYFTFIRCSKKGSRLVLEGKIGAGMCVGRACVCGCAAVGSHQTHSPSSPPQCTELPLLQACAASTSLHPPSQSRDPSLSYGEQVHAQ